MNDPHTCSHEHLEGTCVHASFDRRTTVPHHNDRLTVLTSVKCMDCGTIWQTAAYEGVRYLPEVPRTHSEQEIRMEALTAHRKARNNQA